MHIGSTVRLSRALAARGGSLSPGKRRPHGEGLGDQRWAVGSLASLLGAHGGRGRYRVLLHSRVASLLAASTNSSCLDKRTPCSLSSSPSSVLGPGSPNRAGDGTERCDGDGRWRRHPAPNGCRHRTLCSVDTATLSSRLRSAADGRLLVSASRDHDARIWDATTGILVRRLEGHFGSVADAQFSPDDRWVVTAGPSSVGLWDVRSRRARAVSLWTSEAPGRVVRGRLKRDCQPRGQRCREAVSMRCLR